jgi:K+-transporting ATPase A subunit
MVERSRPSKTKIKRSKPSYLQRKILEYEEKLSALRALLSVITEFQAREDCSFVCKEAVEGIRNHLLSVISKYTKVVEHYKSKLSNAVSRGEEEGFT